MVSSERTDVLAVLARVPSLARQPRQVTELPGGLTNRNFKVTTPDGVFVARLFADDGELLAIDRDHEYRNSVIAAAAGVGAPVIEYRPADRLLVLGYLDGKTLTNADVAEPSTLDRIAVACRALHASGRFAGAFDMFDVQARYYATAVRRHIGLPPGYDALLPAFAAARAALAVKDEGTVPCNNDLLAANFIDNGERIWLIDYEYSGNNDPCFELGNIAASAAWTSMPSATWSPSTTVGRAGPGSREPGCLTSCPGTAGRCGECSSRLPASSISTSDPGRWSVSSWQPVVLPAPRMTTCSPAWSVRTDRWRRADDELREA